MAETKKPAAKKPQTKTAPKPAPKPEQEKAADGAPEFTAKIELPAEVASQLRAEAAALGLTAGQYVCALMAYRHSASDA